MLQVGVRRIDDRIHRLGSQIALAQFQHLAGWGITLP
jgi:hypothetical protein